MNTSISKGRTYLLIVLAIPIFFSIIVFIINSLFIPEKIGTNIVRLILTLVLEIFTYQGYSWAKWIFSILCMLGAVIAVIFGIILTIVNPVGLLLIVMGIFYGFVGIFIHKSKEIKSFLEFQKTRR